MKLLFTALLWVLPCLSHWAEEEAVTRWEFKPPRQGAKAGQEIDLIFSAVIDKKWYLYSSDLDPDLGPAVTTFTFEPDGAFELIGDVQPVAPKKKWDRTWKGEITYFERKAEFRQKVKILKADYRISGKISGQVCSEKEGQCLPFQQPFLFQ